MAIPSVGTAAGLWTAQKTLQATFGELQELISQPFVESMSLVR